MKEGQQKGQSVLSVVIPVYNEFSTFLELLRRVESAPLPDGVTKEIIVVDDRALAAVCPIT